MRFSLLTLFFIGCTLFVSAQEFNARVTINTPQLQTVDPGVFKTLEKSLIQLVNETAWTDDEYEQYERINVNMTLNITKENSATSFDATMLIQASRPVFNTNQETQLIAMQDQYISFSYEQYQPMEFTANTYTNNMTSIMAFYCYVILGMDYDSFSPNGGSDYFQKAQDIFSNIPPNIINASDGWSSVKGNNRNRYWLLENILSPRVAPMRRALYDYHLRGLDRMSEDIEGARKSIANAITKVSQVNRAYPNSMIVQLFGLAKGNEILEIFIKADLATRRKIYQAMIKIDATNASKYEPLR